MTTDKDKLIASIAEAFTYAELAGDEVTAKMLSDSGPALSQRTALNRLNYLVDKGMLVVRKGVGVHQENAYCPASGYTWGQVLHEMKK